MVSRLVVAAAVVVLATASLTAPAFAGAPAGASPEAAALYDDYPVVELVTMGVGALMWERHGHIALCVRYANPRRDACYNYGIGDFGNPGPMIWGFFRGTKTFWVGKMRPGPMLDIYRRADRTIWVQPLPLSDEQEQRVIARLERDILPDNKHYAYDHFWDNCTTRVRDVLDEATDGSLAAMTNDGGDKTYRRLAREGFYGMRVPLLITDIAMGRVTDRKPTYYERMFLPDYMREAAVELWGSQPVVVYQRKGSPPLDDGPSGRVALFFLILVLTAPAWVTRLWGRFETLGLSFALFFPVVLGLALWILAVISPLPYVRLNESCLIFFPLDILLVALPHGLRRKYAAGRVAMLGLVAVAMLVGVLTQPLWAELFWPLVPAATVAFLPGRAR